MPTLNDELRFVLANSFYIRTTMQRRSGTPRTVETTYVWDNMDRIYLSGYPGKRDWVASMAAYPDVTVHTAEMVEGGNLYDIPARARVLRDRNERLPHLLAFIQHWSKRPGFPRRPFQLALFFVKLNRKLRLPWWGPFYFARRIFDRMPCVEVTFTGEPIVRQDGPPPLTEPRFGRE